MTFTGNANLKSLYFYSQSKLTSLSDDSGFIIDGSENFPGVKTARYAKENGGIEYTISKMNKYKNKALAIAIKLENGEVITEEKKNTNLIV